MRGREKKSFLQPEKSKKKSKKNSRKTEAYQLQKKAAGSTERGLIHGYLRPPRSNSSEAENSDRELAKQQPSEFSKSLDLRPRS